MRVACRSEFRARETRICVGRSFMIHESFLVDFFYLPLAQRACPMTSCDTTLFIPRPRGTRLSSGPPSCSGRWESRYFFWRPSDWLINGFAKLVYNFFFKVLQRNERSSPYSNAQVNKRACSGVNNLYLWISTNNEVGTFRPWIFLSKGSIMKLP